MPTFQVGPDGVPIANFSSGSPSPTPMMPAQQNYLPLFRRLHKAKHKRKKSKKMK